MDIQEEFENWIEGDGKRYNEFRNICYAAYKAGKESDLLLPGEDEHVIVPVSDINRLEEARLLLFKLFENGSIDSRMISLINITSPMWKLTHRKYPKVL